MDDVHVATMPSYTPAEAIAVLGAKLKMAGDDAGWRAQAAALDALTDADFGDALRIAPRSDDSRRDWYVGNVQLAFDHFQKADYRVRILFWSENAINVLTQRVRWQEAFPGVSYDVEVLGQQEAL